MNPFVQQMINHKINTLTPKQLQQLGNQYQVPITMDQSHQIIDIIHRQPIDVADETQRKRLFNQISKEVDPTVANKINKLFESFML